MKKRSAMAVLTLAAGAVLAAVSPSPAQAAGPGAEGLGAPGPPNTSVEPLHGAADGEEDSGTEVPGTINSA
ncbi:hypothetical protein [Streptomyces sp. GC420]|uniref:hypothetical protein n=1 Tax=Streptomyces sp. GC420 TaxID=2697568 RepID=UPI0014151EE6|nr:hypothetical protein [Streptomyces sp. GC420]NBM15326.1 hypothetical protein [Streptomyces sp. GC420]